MTDLVPFSVIHLAVVASWSRSAEEAVMWCGEREFPVSAQRIADWHQRDDVRAHLLMAGETPVGYGELWLDPGENEVELARIIISPEARGQGFGRTLVRGLLSEAAKAGYSEIFLRVHPANYAALKCYCGVGFAEVEGALAKEWNAHQPIDYVWLRQRVG
jgi:ribosomal protein S18 acetylase RimI-like enzyme